MRIIIVGGGKLGYFLARNMLDRNYEVKLIEINKIRCMKVANDLDAEVICGDGTQVEVLTSAGISKADCVIAVTGRDQDNLVCCQLAKKRFMVKKTIARANNPRNLEALRKLGLTNAVSSTEIITRLIEQEVDSVGMHLLTTLNKGKASICAITVPSGAVISGSALKNIKTPESCLVVSILRNEELIIPMGEDTIREGDEVIAVCDSKRQREFMKLFSEVRR